MGKTKTGKKHLQLSKKIMLALMAVSLTGGVYFSYNQPVFATDTSKEITISSGEHFDIIGGSIEELSGNKNKNIQTPTNITIAISGGSISEDNLNQAVAGGHQIIGTETFTGNINGETDNINVTISGGVFSGEIYGGSVVERIDLWGDEGKFQVADKSVNLIINGGTFDDNIWGGGSAVGQNITLNIDKVNITINDENNLLKTDVIYGGSYALMGGKATVLESTININGGSNLDLNAGGYASGATHEPNHGDTILNVKNSIINLNGGNVDYILIGGDTFGGSSINKVSSTVDKATINYRGGNLSEATVDSSTKESHLNLFKDLKMSTDGYALEIVNEKFNHFDGFDQNTLTVDGQGKYSLNATVAVNNDVADSSAKFASLNLNNLQNFNGKLEVFNKVKLL